MLLKKISEKLSSKDDLISYIESNYSNLIEKEGIITTKSNFFNKDGRKMLQYGFDSYRNEESNTLFCYWWDFKESKSDYDEFKEELKNFFTKTYNKKVSNVSYLYVGWSREEDGNY